ncbi:tetratricopeptide repeat protein [Legionella cardiaca]|uniref:Tetratricopeptide repeat protein n=1 Tax=Legionella cardiaca TaxID=1071983 RepID=A0ABY8AUL1_9GAMM|nr:tetratricopeptide repeat protein [Legionella cardiaca]WED44273.1 tetratricopeptide repeat protein [Legionella cardiaca]
MPNLFYKDGVNAFHESNYEKAKNLFLQSTYENPEHAKSYFYLGQCHFFCDEKEQAINPLKKFIYLEQNNSSEVANVSYAFDVVGQCYEAANKDTAALRCYETATHVFPSCASAWHNMGLLYLKSAQHYLETDLPKSAKFFNGAQNFIKKALEICSDNPMFLRSIANWYEQYIELLKKAIEDEETTQKNITNNFNYAIQYYKKALDVCKEDDIGLKNIILSNLTECLAQCGHHLYRNKDYKEAQKYYLEAIHLDSDHLIVISQMGMSLFKQECFQEARNYFSSILEKTQDSQEIADAWLNIACTYRLEKEWDKAEASLKQAKTLAPEDSSIADEELKLTDAKLSSLLISTPQTLFSNLNSVPQSSGNKVIQEPNFSPM